MRVTFAVHGRYFAFDLAREMLRRGHDVTLLTNYPAAVVERFGVPRAHVRSLVLHGLASRAAWPLYHRNRRLYPEAFLHRLFGRWAQRHVARAASDVVVAWSGVAEEVFAAMPTAACVRMLVRGSAHIRTQARLLSEEQKRSGVAQDQPSAWIVARELREYALADRIIVLSSFAYRTFVAEEVPASKLAVLPLGTDLAAFSPSREVIDARCERIASGQPLRVLYVGALSFRKGFSDLVMVVEALRGEPFEFRFVGPRAPETATLTAPLAYAGVVADARPETELANTYAWGDVFLFPTIEDGYAVVLAQALAAGLPLITTTNCSGPDLVRDGDTGWVVPIRCPRALIDRLRWCHTHRQALAAMVNRIQAEFRPRDWRDVASTFEDICVKLEVGSA